MSENSKEKKNSSMSWKYSNALESIEHISISPVYKLFIGGKFVNPISKKYFHSSNPANEKKLAKIALAGKSDVNKAVLAAKSAYDNIWEKIDPKERGKYLFRIARLIQEKSRELAIIESLDGGKPIRESRDIDIPLAAAHFFYYLSSLHRALASGQTGGCRNTWLIQPWLRTLVPIAPFQVT